MTTGPARKQLDFREPPLNEVAIGVQYTPIPGYSSVSSGGVWDLYKGTFPSVQEHPRIEPQFETFGGTNPNPGLQFRMGTPVSNRLWFVSHMQDELIQFQPDRFFTNWRRRAGGDQYPKFSHISQLFRNNLDLLANFSQSEFSHNLDINQAEVVYVNLIPVTDFDNLGFWLDVWSGVEKFKLETFNANFTEVVNNSSDMPVARLTCSIQSVMINGGSGKAFSLTLTFRGKPATNSIASAAEFIERGHQYIVERFVEITTTEAHKCWGKD
jgi:uncharacterized protein (TIGR04255 family)